jgi:hypothetical protein
MENLMKRIRDIKYLALPQTQTSGVRGREDWRCAGSVWCCFVGAKMLAFHDEGIWLDIDDPFAVAAGVA